MRIISKMLDSERWVVSGHTMYDLVLGWSLAVAFSFTRTCAFLRKSECRFVRPDIREMVYDAAIFLSGDLLRWKGCIEFLCWMVGSGE